MARQVGRVLPLDDLHLAVRNSHGEHQPNLFVQPHGPKFEVLRRIFDHEFRSQMPLLSLLLLLLLRLLSDNTFSLAPDDDLLVVPARSQNPILSKLRISPSNSPYSTSVALVSRERLLVCPGVVLGLLTQFLRVNLVPYLNLLVGTASGYLVAIEIKLHIMDEIVVAQRHRSHNIICLHRINDSNPLLKF